MSIGPFVNLQEKAVDPLIPNKQQQPVTYHAFFFLTSVA